MVKNRLRGKKVLVTAGPTWVALDSVRVISNVSTGEMGLMCVRAAASLGARVDLLLGPVCRNAGSKKIRVFRFTYFDELKRLIETRLKSEKYDVVIHAAAVSDYMTRPSAGKISSHREKLVLSLTRAPKLIDIMRRLQPDALLVMFKLESGVTDTVLLKRSVEAMKKSGADLAVANQRVGTGYRGYVLGSDGVSDRHTSRRDLAQALLRRIEGKLRT